MKLGIYGGKAFGFVATNLKNKYLMVGVYMIILTLVFIGGFQTGGFNEGVTAVGAISVGVDAKLQENTENFLDNKAINENREDYVPVLKEKPDKGIFKKIGIWFANIFTLIWAWLKVKWLFIMSIAFLGWVLYMYFMLAFTIYNVWCIVNDTSRIYINIVLTILSLLALHYTYFNIALGEVRMPLEGFIFFIQNFPSIWETVGVYFDADRLTDMAYDNSSMVVENISNGSV